MVCWRSLLWFLLEQLLSNLYSFLQESVSSLVRCWLDPGLLPQEAASPFLPSASYELITTGRLQRSQPATQGRAHACECGSKGEASLFVVCFCCFSWWASELRWWWQLGEGCWKSGWVSLGREVGCESCNWDIYSEYCWQQWWLLWLTVCLQW